MSKTSTQNTCAVHDVLMGSLQDQINSIEKGQKEVKNLIINSHRDSTDAAERNRQAVELSADKNNKALNRLTRRLDEEICKFHDRDREYILALNALKIDTNNALNTLKAKHMALTVGGIAIAGTITFLLNLFRVANTILEIIPVVH